MKESFANTPKSFARYIEILNALNVEPGARLLDYGCSWGYGTWQFAQQGYEATGFDVSRRRVQFGRERLALDLVADREEIHGQFDVLFSTHVVEHVPAVASLFSFALSKLKPNGLFVAITPNGSMAYRERKPTNWQRVWGFKHPILLDDEYLRSQFEGFPCLITSRLTGLEALDSWSRGRETVVGDMRGWELLVAVRSAERAVIA